jgi:hypothetical protein
MRVKGPNGVEIDVPENIASGLVGDGDRGYEYAPEPKRRGRPTKTETK